MSNKKTNGILIAAFILLASSNVEGAGNLTYPNPSSSTYKDDVNARVYSAYPEKIEYKTLKAKAESGDPRSQWMHGRQLFSGWVTDEDSLGTMQLIDVLNAPEVSEKTKTEGLVFLRKSATQNFTPALLSLCTCLRFSLQKRKSLKL